MTFLVTYCVKFLCPKHYFKLARVSLNIVTTNEFIRMNYAPQILALLATDSVRYVIASKFLLLLRTQTFNLDL